MAAGLLIGNPAVAITGFGLLGIGLGSIIPTLFSAAGNQPDLAPGAAVATVSAIGWAGFLCGPPLIGFIAGHSSLPWLWASSPYSPASSRWSHGAPRHWTRHSKAQQPFQ
jgi:MFS family permease